MHTDPDLHPASDAATREAGRALFYTPANSFEHLQPAVPRHVFRAEAALAQDAGTPTGEIVLDLAAVLALPYPATTPTLLARYLVLRRGETFARARQASTEVYHVMRGRGHSSQGDSVMPWGPGDTLLFPGGQPVQHAAPHEDALLYLVTDEPLLSFCGASAAALPCARVLPAHFTRAAMLQALDGIAHRSSAEQAGRAVIFTTPQFAQTHTIGPFISANINTLLPGDDQLAHRHNAAALTLALECDRVHSLIEGQQVDWAEGAVMVTPPGDLHSHHNCGSKTMWSFVAQDAGLHYYARTVGFSFA
jgi:gentisate 1,2-dioxygenase